MDLIQFFGRFHVLVLHLPIGILMLAALNELHTLFTKKERNDLVNWIWFWGAITAIAACVLGIMLSQGAGYTEHAIFIHRTFGFCVVAIAITCWLYFKQNRINNPIIDASLAVIQLFLLFSTGHYGANMTHGETYLVEHAPDPVRILIGLDPHPEPRPIITALNEADVYLDVIEPMLRSRCTSCHNESKQKGKLNLASIAGINKGGRSGHTIVVGDAENSELYKRITLEHDDKEFMPAEGKTPLTNEQVNAIKWWINSGAVTQGKVSDYAKEPADKALLRHLLELHDSSSIKALPKIVAISNQQAQQLTAHGFVVKNLSNQSNYLDLDLSISKNPITQNMLNDLLDIKDHIVWLNLARAQLTNEQLATIAKLPNIMKLRLDHSNISSSKIKILSNLKKLHYLNLYGTQVNNAVLTELGNFPTLKQVYLTSTNVTAEAIEEYRTKLAPKKTAINFHFVAPKAATLTE